MTIIHVLTHIRFLTRLTLTQGFPITAIMVTYIGTEFTFEFIKLSETFTEPLGKSQYPNTF